MRGLPYWRLSGFYFFNSLALGFLLPFWGLYMKSLNYSPKYIALFSTLLMSTNIFSPYLWGWLADHWGHRMRLVQGGALLSVLSFSILYRDHGIGLMLLAVTVCGFFWQGINAQFEVVTLGYLKQQTKHYSRIRLWGSAGFVAAVVGGGSLFDWLEISYLPYFIIISLALMSACTFVLKASNQVHFQRERGETIWPVLRKPIVWGILLVAAMAYFSHGTYYGFYSIYLENRQMSTGLIGWLWGIAVLAELAVFLLIPTLFKYLSLPGLIQISLLFTVLRWAGIGLFAEYIGVLVLCQLLHGFSFSALHACLIEFIHQKFSARLQGRGQALYYAFCVGLGQAGGTLSSGWLWGWSETGSFMFSSGVAAIALILVRYLFSRRLSTGNGTSAFPH